MSRGGETEMAGGRARRVGTVIPEDTPPQQLRALWDRYAEVNDPAIHALPRAYRAAILRRIRTLLAQVVADDAA